MDLGWEELLRVAIIAISTFAIGAFAKPLFLALRDYCVWSAIDAYIKQSNFSKRANQYASNKAKHNALAKNKLTAHFRVDGNSFYHGDTEITEDQYKSITHEMERTSSKVFELQKRIDKEASLIGSALKHYKQDDTNPAIAIIQFYEKKSYEQRGLDYPENE